MSLSLTCRSFHTRTVIFHGLCKFGFDENPNTTPMLCLQWKFISSCLCWLTPVTKATIYKALEANLIFTQWNKISHLEKVRSGWSSFTVMVEATYHTACGLTHAEGLFWSLFTWSHAESPPLLTHTCKQLPAMTASFCNPPSVTWHTLTQTHTHSTLTLCFNHLNTHIKGLDQVLHLHMHVCASLFRFPCNLLIIHPSWVL